MTESTATCIRGCTRRDRHQSECAEAECRGCLPRSATNGQFCHPCHRRLEQWLSGEPEVSLEWVHGWLDEAKRGITGTAAKGDWERPKTDDGPAAPLRLAIHDVQTLITDRLFIAEERVREFFDRPAVENFTVQSACRFLRGWQLKIETDMPPEFLYSPTTIDGCDTDRGLWGQFAEVMRDAHMLAPWRPEVRRLPGMPCPECDRCSMVIYGGETDVTCQSCWMMFTRANYDRWAELVAWERQQQEAS